MSELKYVQEGFTAVTPYLYAKIELVDFLQKAFDAQIVHEPQPEPNGHFHAEARIGDAHVLFGNGYFSDPSMSTAIYLYVPDADATYKRALSLGAKSVREPKTETWGDRTAGIKDTSGNTWWLATHKPKQ